MNAAWVDGSFLLAIASGELEAQDLAARLDGFDKVYASDLVEAEVLSALAREAMALPDVDAFASVNWTFPDRPLTQEFASILGEDYLRGVGLWHLACALYLSPDARELSFLTLDARQKRVAKKLGFPT